MKRSTFLNKAGLAIASLGLSALGTVSAATLNVNPGDSIQSAVDAAAAGDTIHIAGGVYEEQIVVSNKNLNLVGEAAAILKAPAGMTALLEVACIAANQTSTGAGLTHVEVLDNTFSDNESNIVMLGDDANPVVAAALRQTFLVEGNTVIGSGPGTDVFEFGIRVTVGASGTIQHNTVTDFLSVAPNAVLGPVGSAGILVFHANKISP